MLVSFRVLCPAPLLRSGRGIEEETIIIQPQIILKYTFYFFYAFFNLEIWNPRAKLK